tara:strand:+ start:490 stop:654 length:165 start_codon:yes stop_codon:yes gene_type:complete
MKNIDVHEASRSKQRSIFLELEDVISFQTEIPKSIQQAMKDYIGNMFDSNYFIN